MRHGWFEIALARGMNMLQLEDLVSQDYRDQLRTMHEGAVWGSSSARWAQMIMRRAKKRNFSSVLDYGCGSGQLQKLLPGLDVRDYDPGVLGKELLPEPADFVVCIDVLEHIEPDKVLSVLDHIRSLTKHVALLVVATRPAEKRLPDGRNAHLTIDNAAWWYTKFSDPEFLLSVIACSPLELSVWLARKS